MSDNSDKLTPWQQWLKDEYAWQEGMTAIDIREHYAREMDYQWPWRWGIATSLSYNYGKRYVILFGDDMPSLILEENTVDPRDELAFEYETHMIIAGYYRVYHAEND